MLKIFTIKRKEIVFNYKTILKVYKDISVSLEDLKIINCIMFSIMLNYLIFNIKLWMGSVYTWKKSTNHKIKICTEKHPVVQRFILMVCNIHIQ